MPFTIIRGDAVKVRADAIINIISEGDEVVNVGIEKSHKLHCKYIISATAPIGNGDGDETKQLLCSCFKSSLELAEKHKCKSVVLPLISDCHHVAVKAVSDFLKNSEMEIVLAVPDNENMALSGSFADEIKSYINNVYSEAHFAETAVFESAMPFMQRVEGHSFAKAEPNLDKRLKNLDMSFSQKLMKMIDESGMKDVEVYKAANISKQLFSKIRSDKNYHPKKITVFAFAIGLKLPLTETQELLKSAGYAMTHNDKTDIIIEYFIEHGRYDIYEINEVLFDYDLPLIGG